MKLLFVVNPISGGINKEPFLKSAKSICQKYGIEFRIFKTSGKDDEARLKKELSDFKPDRVASVGGDGSTLFTAIVLKNTSIPMGIIPLGSANGMAAELFVNPNPTAALIDIIASKIIAGLDMVLVNDKYYSIHIGDVGINARIVDDYAKDKKRGMTTYAKYFIAELKKSKPFEITIKANGKTYRESGVMTGICNARKYGTGIPLNLNGNPMDGKFEIVVVRNINIHSLIKSGLSKFDERFSNSHNGLVIQTTEAEIHFDKPRLLQLDGEVIGKFEKLDIKIMAGAIKFISHGENTYINPGYSKS